MNDISGVPFEGNLHFGYRHLFPDSQHSFGVYGAFDRRKTASGNYFNQFTLGGEYWFSKIFIGANVYQPIGAATKKIRENDGLTDDASPAGTVYRNVGVTYDLLKEKVLPGVDIEVGYELLPGLVGYVGGYYFSASEVATVCGPRARITYDWFLDNSRGILKVLDKFGFEASVQNDKYRGTIWRFSTNFRLGWSSSRQQSALPGISYHMVDRVRRDADLVVGKIMRHSHIRKLRIKRTDNHQEFYSALEESGIDAIDVNFDINNIDPAMIKKARSRAPWIFIDDQISHHYLGELLNSHRVVKSTSLKLNNGGKITEEANNTLTQIGYRVINSKSYSVIDYARVAARPTILPIEVKITKPINRRTIFPGKKEIIRQKKILRGEVNPNPFFLKQQCIVNLPRGKARHPSRTELDRKRKILKTIKQQES